MSTTVYLETSIVSYLTGRASRDVVIKAHQLVTRKWWNMQRLNFELFVSPLVLQEAATGDPTTAHRRLESVRGLYPCWQ